MGRRCFTLVAAAGIALFWAGLPNASSEELTLSAVKTNVPQRLGVTAGSSVVIESAAKLKRASLANPDIADAVVLSPQQIYVIGKPKRTRSKGGLDAIIGMVHDPKRDVARRHDDYLWGDAS